MSYFDIIRELRTGKPDVSKAVSKLRLIGWIAAGSGVWNFIFPYLVQTEEIPFPFSRYYPVTALLSFSIASFLFFRSAKEIKAGRKEGVRLGQWGIIISLIAIIALAIMMAGSDDFLPGDLPFRIFYIVAICVVLGQFAVPAYLGIRYLERLPLGKTGRDRLRAAPVYGEPQHRVKEPSQKYREALLPFGITGTFFLLIAGILISVFAVQTFFGMEFMGVIFVPGFILVFFGPVAYNYLPSTFEKKRKPIASFTGGGSIFMFNGTWPFFRLIIYSEGIEIRVMLHRFFLPYDRIKDIPEKSGFFSRGLVIRSDLPGVPSSIRFYSLSSKKAAKTITEARTRYMETGTG